MFAVAAETLENCSSDLIARCRSEVMQPLKESLAQAQRKEPETIFSAELKTWYECYREEFEKICVRGAQEVVQFYKKGLRQLLEEKKPEFRLCSRFPEFTSALMAHFETLLKTMHDAILNQTSQAILSYFGIWDRLIGNPTLQIETFISKTSTEFNVHFVEPERVVNTIAAAFVLQGDLHPLELPRQAAEVAAGISTWKEGCADRRIALQEKQGRIERARRGIQEVLSACGLAMPIVLPRQMANPGACCPLRRALKGWCEQTAALLIEMKAELTATDRVRSINSSFHPVLSSHSHHIYFDSLPTALPNHTAVLMR